MFVVFFCSQVKYHSTNFCFTDTFRGTAVSVVSCLSKRGYYLQQRVHPPPDTRHLASWGPLVHLGSTGKATPIAHTMFRLYESLFLFLLSFTSSLGRFASFSFCSAASLPFPFLPFRAQSCLFVLLFPTPAALPFPPFSLLRTFLALRVLPFHHPRLMYFFFVPISFASLLSQWSWDHKAGPS